MAMVFPVSTHNYELRYWLAAGGIHPGFYSPRDVIGPDRRRRAALGDAAAADAGDARGRHDQRLLASASRGTSRPSFKGVGVPVVTDYEIWKNNPEKVFGVTEGVGRRRIRTRTLALHQGADPRRACGSTRTTARTARRRRRSCRARNTSAPTTAVIANSMTGTFEYGKGDKRAGAGFQRVLPLLRELPVLLATPSGTSRRCAAGARSPKPSRTSGTRDAPRAVYRPDVYLKAAQLLVAEGKAKEDDFPWDTDGYRAPTTEFIDGIEYDGRKPNAYIDKLADRPEGQPEGEGGKSSARQLRERRVRTAGR